MRWENGNALDAVSRLSLVPKQQVIQVVWFGMHLITFCDNICTLWVVYFGLT